MQNSSSDVYILLALSGIYLNEKRNEKKNPLRNKMSTAHWNICAIVCAVGRVYIGWAYVSGSHNEYHASSYRRTLNCLFGCVHRYCLCLHGERIIIKSYRYPGLAWPSHTVKTGNWITIASHAVGMCVGCLFRSAIRNLPRFGSACGSMPKNLSPLSNHLFVYCVCSNRISFWHRRVPFS